MLFLPLKEGPKSVYFYSDIFAKLRSETLATERAQDVSSLLIIQQDISSLSPLGPILENSVPKLGHEFLI